LQRAITRFSAACRKFCGKWRILRWGIKISMPWNIAGPVRSSLLQDDEFCYFLINTSSIHKYIIGPPSPLILQRGSHMRPSLCMDFSPFIKILCFLYHFSLFLRQILIKRGEINKIMLYIFTQYFGTLLGDRKRIWPVKSRTKIPKKFTCSGLDQPR